MDEEEFKGLKRGDIIRNRNSPDAYVVDCNLDGEIIGVRTVLATNWREWKKV